MIGSRKLPIITLPSRRRGGVFFTMIIFIMMLASTTLMYYYFHRARQLEQELTALRGPATSTSAQARGSIKIGESQYRLASWDEQDKAPAPAAIEPAQNQVTEPTPEPSVQHHQPQLPETTPVVAETPAPEPAAVPTPAKEEDHTPPEEQVAEEASNQQREQPAATPTATPSPSRTPRATPSGPIQSIYDLQKPATDEPKVRVRAPQRTP